MSEIIDKVSGFLSHSNFWKENLRHLECPNVVYHEINLETNLHPLGLEFLFLKYLEGRGQDVRNVGHAVFGGCGYLKTYTTERPIVNFVWKYKSDVTIGPQPEQWFSTWKKAHETDYFMRVKPRHANVGDLEAVDTYFHSAHWREVLSKLSDPDIEHFHVFLRTELHAYDLQGPFTNAIRAEGFEINVPPFYLTQTDDHPLADGRDAIMIGLIPDGTTSVEISLIHTKNVVLQPKELSEAERVYGGDGWRLSEFKEFIRGAPYEVLTLSEAQVIVERVLDSEFARERTD